MADPTASARQADCVCGHEWEAHYGGGCDYRDCGCRRYPPDNDARSEATTDV